MTVRCPSCQLEYDDTYRLTYCPHAEFQMRTVATNPQGQTKVCTSLDELRRWMLGTVRTRFVICGGCGFSVRPPMMVEQCERCGWRPEPDPTEIGGSR